MIRSSLRLAQKTLQLQQFQGLLGSSPIVPLLGSRLYQYHPCTHTAANRAILCRQLSTKPAVSGVDPPEECKQSDQDIAVGSEAWALNEIKNLPFDDEKRFKVIQLEYDVWDSTGVAVPANVTNAQWLELLRTCPTISSRRKLFLFWFKKERAIENQRLKKIEGRRLHEERLANIEQLKAEGLYTDTRNTIFMYVREPTMLVHYYNNMYHAMLHGPKLVFDFGFENHMTERENLNVAKQFLYCHAANKVAKEPFHIHLCNVDYDGPVYSQLKKSSGESISSFPMTITDKSYLDLFPEEDLIYLSPNAPRVMKEFDPEKVYIIGGIVDTRKQEPLTFAKAKRQRIQTMKLPLDHFLQWTSGSKNLTLDQMTSILLNVKETKDWNKALQFVPIRKRTPPKPKRKYNLLQDDDDQSF